jgi:2'-5' RNA ligase
LDGLIGHVEALVTRVLRGLAETVAKLVGATPSAAALSEDDLQVLRRGWTTVVEAELVPALQDVYRESAQVMADDLADAGRPVDVLSLEAPDAADFLDAATNRLVAVSDTLWERARNALAEGIRAGDGIDDLAARLQEHGFGEARARVIARTETVAAANAASLAQAMRLGDPTLRKEWLATMDGSLCDERTRETHCATNGQVQPLDEPFEVGDTWLMYPGQPVGPAAEVINCRCSQGYLLEDDIVDDTPLTAAAEVHTGAMVALRPSLEDAKRLAVDGGEPADQLHATLAYLGAAADIPDESQARIIEAIWQVAEGMQPLTVEGFAVSVFNPGDSNDRDPCIVLGLSGDGLDDVHSHVGEALSNLASEPAGFTLPVQHAPWQPHVTLVYTDDVSMVERLADRVGPVTFDAIRVAFGGEVFDIPLGQSVDDGDVPDGDEDFDWSAYFQAAIQAQFQSRMPPQLQAYWIRKLRLGTKGSFDRCVRELREYFPEDTEGLCANLYHTATGRWPGRKKDQADGGETVVALADEAVALPEDSASLPESPVAAADPLAFQPGEHWHAVANIEDVSTGLRRFTPGALTWREPPFAFHWQWRSSAHGGQPETVHVGTVARVERDPVNPNEIHMWGTLDLGGADGREYGRRLVEGIERWVSIGLDESFRESDIEYVYPTGFDVEAVELVEVEPEEMLISKGRIGELTGVSVPAQHEATIEPSPELIDAMGPLTAAAVRSHDTPTVEEPWDADANEKRLPSPLPLTTAREEYAWINDERVEGDHVPKDACALPHHEVSEDGRPGAANVDAVRNALARLSQTDIPEADREAVHAHLAAHLRDAGGEPGDLSSDAPTADAPHVHLDDMGEREHEHELEVDLNDDGTLTIADADVSADQAVALADAIEELLAATDGPHERHVEGVGTVRRGERADIRLELTDAEPVTMSPADADALVVVLRSFAGDDVDELAEIVTASAKSSRRVLRSAAIALGPARVAQVIVAAGRGGHHTITIPAVPPAEWFAEPTDVAPQGALTVTDEGRIYGYLAPAGVAHRGYRNRRVEVPRGTVDYSRWMGGEAIVAGGGRVVAGPITMNCGHMPPTASSDPAARMEHYDNTCSVVAQAAIGENDKGVWIAGALLPGVSAEQVSRMLACRLSGDWAPHPEKPGWREFVAALLVPVPGFPMARSAPSTVRIAEGALVASAVPVRLEITEQPPPAAAPSPDLRPVLERVARNVGWDYASRMASLTNRMKGTA